MARTRRNLGCKVLRSEVRKTGRLVPTHLASNLVHLELPKVSWGLLNLTPQERPLRRLCNLRSNGQWCHPQLLSSRYLCMRS